MKAILTVGISASGKTGWAKAFCLKNGYFNINRDDIRFSVTGAENWREFKNNRKFEEMVTAVQRDMIGVAAKNGRNVVISDTNLNPLYRMELIDYLKQLGYDVELKEFEVALEEAFKRDAIRPNGVGRDVIYGQYQMWLRYKKRKVYNGTSGKPPAFIVDVDGTVARMSGRKAYDWHAVGDDLPRDEVIAMVHGLVAAGHKIIMLSGRDSVCRDETVEWLHMYLGYNAFDENWFFMRAADDRRRDVVVKEELFWEHIADHWNVVGAIDDRPCVVRLWHELGIKNVIAVANPYIEF